MSRPRLKIDYEEVRRLLHLGWGCRRIARKIGVSRSLIVRITNGQRPSSGPPRYVASPRTRRSESDRASAHQLLSLGRGAANDAEFADAKTRLDDLLATRPDHSPI